MAEYIPAGQFINLKIALALYESVATLARMHIVLEIYRAWMSVEVPPSFIEDRSNRPVFQDYCDLTQIDDDNSSDILPGDSSSQMTIYSDIDDDDDDDCSSDESDETRDKLDEPHDRVDETHDKLLHARIEQWRASVDSDNHS